MYTAYLHHCQWELTLILEFEIICGYWWLIARRRLEIKESNHTVKEIITSEVWETYKFLEESFFSEFWLKTITLKLKSPFQLWNNGGMSSWNNDQCVIYGCPIRVRAETTSFCLLFWFSVVYGWVISGLMVRRRFSWYFMFHSSWFLFQILESMSCFTWQSFYISILSGRTIPYMWIKERHRFP